MSAVLLHTDRPHSEHRGKDEKWHLHPPTFAVARVVVGSSSVCQPVTAACIVPALPTAACAAVTPRHPFKLQTYSH